MRCALSPTTTSITISKNSVVLLISRRVVASTAHGHVLFFHDEVWGCCQNHLLSTDFPPLALPFIPSTLPDTVSATPNSRRIKCWRASISCISGRVPLLMLQRSPVISML